MNKKIAFIADGFSDRNFTSGGLKLNFMLLAQLVARGYEVHVFAKHYYKQIEADGFVVHDFKDFVNKEDFSFVLSAQAMGAADITYLHDHTNIFRFNNLYGRFAKFVNQIFRKTQLEKRRKFDEVIKENLKNTGKIIVSSEILKQDYVENFNIPEDRFVIIPPPIFIKSQVSGVKPPAGKFIFGISAVGFERKGGYVTLHAIAKLKKKCKNFKVIIIYPKVNCFIKTIIFLQGLRNYVEFIPCQENMEEFYTKINALLMPSKVEPFGMVTTEAMSFGKPAIVSGISGAADIVKDGENGLIAENDKNFAENLSKAMQKMIELSENEYQRMSENAVETVKTFDITTFTDKYIKVIDNLKNKI